MQQIAQIANGFKNKPKLVFRILFWGVIIINLLFYIGLPSLFLLTPIPRLFSSIFWPNIDISDIYIAWGIGFFAVFVMPFLLLINLGLILTKLKRKYLLWVFIILNIITIFFFGYPVLISQISEVKQRSVEVKFPMLIHEIATEVKAITRPDDPQWTDPREILRWGQEFIKLPDAWDITTGIPSVKIGVIDVGFDINHEDLRENIDPPITNIHIADHGTNIAGIVGARGNNGKGVAGIMWQTNLLPYDARIPYTENTIFITAIKKMAVAISNGARIINYSAGTEYSFITTPFLELEKEAWRYYLLDYFKDSNIVFVFAAGNKGIPVNRVAPASLAEEYDNVISAGAIQRDGNLSPFSNWGDAVIVAAPGEDIFTTFPNNQYKFVTPGGTSFSAPFVSGLAGLIYSVDSSQYEGKYKGKVLTSKDVKELIIEGAIKGDKFVVGPDGHHIPIINAYESLKLLVEPPAPPIPPGTWTSAGNMNIARTFHTATLLPNGKVIIVGGSDGNQALKSVELYDSQTGQFTLTGEMSMPRQDHTATLLNNGKVLIAGGWDRINPDVYGTAELYDPQTGAFSFIGNMTISRHLHTAILLQDGKVLIVGGENGINATLKTSEIYNPDTNTFSPSGLMSVPRRHHTATLLLNGKVLIVGGDNAGGGYPNVTTAEIYNPANDTFQPPIDLVGRRVWHTATLLENGDVLVAGGYASPQPVISAELFNYQTSSFEPVGEMNQPLRRYHTATLLSNKKVLIAGGMMAAVPPYVINSSEIYNLETKTFIPTSNLIAGRSAHTAMALSDNRILVTGGDGTIAGGIATSSAEVYNP